MALPLVLVLLLALTALAHGTLLLARREVQASGSFRRVLQARRGAEGGVALTLERMPEGAGERVPGTVVPVVAGSTRDGGWYRGDLLWLDRELFLVAGRGGSRDWPGEGREGWVGWSLDPVTRMGALRAVLEVGEGVTFQGSARVLGSDLLSDPTEWPSGICEPQLAILDSLFPSGSLPATAPLGPSHLPDAGPGGAIPPLGLLSGSVLLDRGGAGEETGPSPEAGSGCPGDGGPAFLAVPGSLTLDGGRLCGLLVVGGTLRLTGGHRFQGMALVGEDVILQDGARLEGLGRVGGALQVMDRALVRGSACAAFRALLETAALPAPLPLPSGSRIHPF